VLVAVLGLVVTIKLYRQYALAPYQVTVSQIGPVTDHSVTITFSVRKPAGRPASCTVRARARDGREVGRTEVAVPAGSPDQTTASVTVTLTTSARPIVAEVPGCGPAR
jgi:uncharacterized protein DUF4307